VIDDRSPVIDALEVERIVSRGGLVVFPADTVYGIGCDPLNSFAVERLYLLKRRSRDKPCAVMFFDIDWALASLPELGRRTREALGRLMPGGVSVLLPNPARRFPLACGADPLTLGLRVIRGDLRGPLLQSSANRAGGPDPCGLAEVPELIRAAADVVLEGGELPGTPSTFVDLRSYEHDGSWTMVREGAVGEEVVREALGGGGAFAGFDPRTYRVEIRADIPDFDQLQERVVALSGDQAARRILELGIGTGETARRLLERHPGAMVVGVDASAEMLAAASEVLPEDRVELSVARLEDPLPPGPFDVVVSVLAIHHLSDQAKAELFRRIRSMLKPRSRFVLGDVVVPADPRDAIIPLTDGFDRPSTVSDQLTWLEAAQFDASVAWQHRDLAVIIAEPVYRR
jgi:tRNA threonylcarbamoyl adenosine modification protein (Sua5/YciO/YrdC/YwlC family)